MDEKKRFQIAGEVITKMINELEAAGASSPYITFSARDEVFVIDYFHYKDISPDPRAYLGSTLQEAFDKAMQGLEE